MLSQTEPVQATDVDLLVQQIITARLGPTPESDPVCDDQSSEEYHQALANLITDINLTDQCSQPGDDLVSHGTIERNGSKVKVTSLLKDLQPHRERPSKDRSKRFAAGDMHRDKPVPENHNLVEFQYWAVMPLQKQLQAAKVFILGQVVYISEGDKHCRSASTENPNVFVIVLAYKYHPATNTYTIDGKTGICKAAKVLLSDLTKFICTEVSGDLKITVLPTEYIPFHDDLDIEGRLPRENPSEDEDNDEEIGDPYLVEKIVQRRFFRNNQYEYLVKWCGYSDSDNTWELPSNVPDDIQSAFERTLVEPSSNPRPRPQGLRQSRSVAHRKDYILNT